jgi:hypothetical protein
VGVGGGVKGDRGKLCSVTFSWDSYCINERIAVHTQFIFEMPEIAPTSAQYRDTIPELTSTGICHRSIKLANVHLCFRSV